MQAGHPQEDADGRVVFVDRALWQQLARARTTEDYASAWLALQCSMLGGARGGVVVYGEPEVGPFRRVASFPEDAAPSATLTNLCQAALDSGEAQVVEPATRSGEDLALAYPLRVDGKVYGVAGLQLRAGAADPTKALRQVQWGASWLDSWVRREHAGDEQRLAERLMAVLDLVATALAHERFKSAATALATEVATQLRCDRVSVGVVRGGQCETVVLSHSAERGARMNVMRAIGAAMDEAVDQGGALRHPERVDRALLVRREHEALAQHGNGALLTIPLFGAGGIYGALLLERSAAEEFGDDEVELCKSVALAVGPMFEIKRRQDRSVARKLLDSTQAHASALLGPRHWGLKLVAAGVLAGSMWLGLATGEFRVTADATVEGAVRRTVTAPVDGYLATVDARPGDAVLADQVLASFDDRDLRLQRLQVVSERAQLTARVLEATARGERSQAQVLNAQVRQSDAHLALLDEQLARTSVRAPFAGLVVNGDLSQSLGAPLQRGAVMFEIAPLDAYRVVLGVDEHDVAAVGAGQKGTLVLSALPSEPLAFTVQRVTPVASVSEGSNVFRVEAALERGDPRVRPGMNGVAKVTIDERRVGYIWTHDVVRWVRLRLWSWWP